MKKLILFLILISIYNLISAQIRGQVVDNISAKGISNVNIIKKHSGLGVSTDKKGFFNFKYFRIGDTLIISHIAYERRQIIIRDSIVKIFTQPIQNILSEASVYSKKEAIRIIENPWVIDYEIINDSSLLIAKIGNSGSRVELLINNKSKAYPFSNVDKIEKNCLNDIYIIRGDTAYQVLINKKELYFSAFTSLQKLKLANKYCDELINNKQYFNYFTSLNKLNIFSILQDSIPQPFYKIFDKQNYKFTSSYSCQFTRLSQRINGGSGRMGDNWTDGKNNQKQYKYLEDLEDYLAVLTKLKTISKLVYYQNQLIILDNVNAEIVYFNDESKINTIKHFQLIFKNKNIKSIIQDKKTEQVYYFVLENNKLNIYLFDFEKLSFIYVMSQNKHIEEPKINNGILYYLNYDIYNETRKLYKISLY